MIPSDQSIEQTINREQKCHGGITGYSTSPGTVQRWVLTSHTVSKCFSKLESDLLISSKSSRPKDIGPARIAFDENAVQRTYEILASWGNPFNFRQSLVHLFSGVEAALDVQRDLLTAEESGQSALMSFVTDRIQSNNVSFYDRIKRLSLKTFKSMAVKKVCMAK